MVIYIAALYRQNKSGDFDYSVLERQLKSYHAEEMQPDLWKLVITPNNATAESLVANFKNMMDKGDRIFVTELSETNHSSANYY